MGIAGSLFALIMGFIPPTGVKHWPTPLVRVAHIPRESARTRALDSDAAFKAIHTAYQQVKDHLPSDGVAG
jgi:hypothetical protein